MHVINVINSLAFLDADKSDVRTRGGGRCRSTESIGLQPMWLLSFIHGADTVNRAETCVTALPELDGEMLILAIDLFTSKV